MTGLRKKILIGLGAAGALAAVAVTLRLCLRPRGPSASLDSFSARAARRAYNGAPPVIPHRPLSGTCTDCHTVTGRDLPGLGIAPPNPHLDTAGIGAKARCQQCHVFQQTADLFAENSFVGLSHVLRKGDRLYPAAPPTIPHSLFMRESCNACHTGPAARQEIRCSHPERVRCTQCHAASSPGWSWQTGALLGTSSATGIPKE
jgi:hypothetical protein